MEQGKGGNFDGSRTNPNQDWEWNWRCLDNPSLGRRPFVERKWAMLQVMILWSGGGVIREVTGEGEFSEGGWRFVSARLGNSVTGMVGGMAGGHPRGGERKQSAVGKMREVGTATKFHGMWCAIGNSTGASLEIPQVERERDALGRVRRRAVGEREGENARRNYLQNCDSVMRVGKWLTETGAGGG